MREWERHEGNGSDMKERMSEMMETEKRPWMAPADYERFVRMIREHVVLSILHRAVLRDAERLSEGHKFSRVYRQLLERVAEMANQERHRLRQEIGRIGGQIAEERQDPVAREVWARLRGRVYTMRFQNVWLRARCEVWLMTFLAKTLSEMLDEQQDAVLRR